ncbi:YerC/YecD family TrpR-related protein [Hellea balneolensis]|uniref:YerC/YecD family TrpR-related protein n=1 Tax=Hellea balneolensis TaxID=287478 RepID=UPI00042705A4|nr:YerC/YecD family TrpR-related protein [Hellea balneolensis]
MTNTPQITTRENLAIALTSVKTAEEMERFLVDLCTPAELRALAERWHVAQILDSGDQSYREINALTGVSTTTIGRVARFLKDEPHQGYRAVLDRLQRSENT